MKVIGKMINNMEMELKFGQMGLDTKVNIKMEKNMVLVHLIGPMEANIMEIS